MPEYSCISWHGTRAWDADWSYHARSLAFMQSSKTSVSADREQCIYMAVNMHWEMHEFELPASPEDMSWHILANTDMPPPEDIFSIGEGKRLENQSKFLVGPRSLIILTAG